MLKNCWAWVEKAPVAMAVTALNSAFALKLKKSFKNAVDVLSTAGSCTGPLLLVVANRIPKTSVPRTPRTATTRKARVGAGQDAHPSGAGVAARGAETAGPGVPMYAEGEEARPPPIPSGANERVRTTFGTPTASTPCLVRYPYTGVHGRGAPRAGTDFGAEEVETQDLGLGEHNCQRLLFEIANPGYRIVQLAYFCTHERQP